MGTRTAVMGLVAVSCFSFEVRGQALITTVDTGVRDGGALFGSSCAGIQDIDADGIPDFLVAAEHANGRKGSVFVFSGSSQTQLGILDGHAGDEFGTKIASSPDLDGDGVADILVGMPLSNGTWTDQGRVSIYSGATLSLIRTHVGEGPGADWFGLGLAAIGDINSDGVSEFAVGAINHDVSPYVVQSGRAYVYSGASGGLLYTVSGTSSYEMYGFSIAGAGDIDGDGSADWAVSGIDGSSLSSGDGHVDLISGASGTVIMSFIGSTPAYGSFGQTIDGGVDVTGDSIPDLLVTDPYVSRSAQYAGGAYVYSGANGSLIYDWDGEGADDKFGATARFAGDVNGDGVADILIGSVEPKQVTPEYLYSGATGRLLYRFTTGIVEDLFGTAVAGLGDVNGDQLADVLVGAQYDDQLAQNGGRAYVFAGNELYLQASKRDLLAGDAVTLSIRARQPGAFATMFVTSINGSPFFTLLDAGFTDAVGERNLAGTVPPGLAGMNISLTAFATDTKSGVVDSEPETLTFL